MKKLLFIVLWLTALLGVLPVQAQLPPSITYEASSTAAYETETTTYLNAMATAGASFSSAQKDSINRFVKDLKGLSNPLYTTNNVFSKITILYPFLTGVSATDKINLVNPGTYNYTETGSPTYSTSTYSVAFNGTSQYLNTTHTPNNSGTFGSSDFTMFGVHRIDANTDGNATVGEVGGGNSYMQIQSASFKVINMNGQGAYSASNAQASARLWGAAWSSSTSLTAYFDKTVLATTTPTFNNTPSRSVLIGAFNAASPGFGGAITVDFYIEGTGAWSSAEWAGIYDAAKHLKIGVISITWN